MQKRNHEQTLWYWVKKLEEAGMQKSENDELPSGGTP